jgi:serine/threonine-protein kinase
LVYVARLGDQTQLYVRALDQLEPTPVPGTENAAGPFFSPDGDSVGFFADGKLKKLLLPSGSPLTLADSPAPRGASWGRDGRIVFSPLTTGGLSSISTAGAIPDNLTTPDSDKGEKSHRWPEELPGNRNILYTNWTGSRFDIEVLVVESGERKRLIEDGSYARYVPTGHLVFVRGGNLFAVPFDTRRLEVVGPEISLIEDVAVDPFTGAAVFDFDRDGLLVYAPGGPVLPSAEGIGRLLRSSRQGVADTLLPAERVFQLPRLSPDGTELVVTISEGDRSDIWGSDLGRGTMTRLTFEGNNAAAIWTPDGKRVVFSSDRDGVFNLYWKPSDGSGDAERLTTSDDIQMPNSMSPDGKTLLLSELDPETGFDIVLLPMDGRRRPESFLETPFNEVGAAFSPDGRWIAYVSDESGQNEVYVRAYPEGGKRLISVGGGTEPVWAPNGRELFYRNQEWMMAVSLETEPSFEAGKPRPLFEAPFADSEAAYPNFDITPNGQSFIMIQTKVESAATRLLVVSNWFEELKDRAPSQ